VRRCLLATVLALSASAFAASAGFTPAERAAVRQLDDEVRADCVAEMTQLKARETAAGIDASPVSQVFNITGWPGYCPCASAEFMRRVTPGMLRRNSEQKGAEVGRIAATTCAVRHLKAHYPQACAAMVDSLGALAQAAGASQPAVGPEPAQVSRFCACTQVDIDSLDADNFDGFARQTIADYTAYHRDGRLPEPTGPSLLASMQRCGVVTLWRVQPD